MPAPFGLTAKGFEPMQTSDIIKAITADLQVALGPAIDLSSFSPLGQAVGVLAANLASVWELAQATYNAAYPDTAEGVSLDNVAAINNVTRLPATFSTLPVETITGTPGTTILGTDTSTTPFQISVDGSDGTIVFQCTKTTVIPALGFANVPMQATTTGPLAAPAGSLTVIVTPTAGIVSATNSADAFLGTDIETDEAYRARRLTELQRSGTATNEGIRHTVALVPGVSRAGIIENDTDATVGDLTPHSIEVFAIGGDDQAIANAIFASKAAGIQTIGTTTENVNDSQGFSHIIKFSRPTGVTIFIVVNVTRDDNTADGSPFPGDGDVEIQNKLVTYGTTLGLGENIINPKLISVVMEVVGIADLAVLVDIVALPDAWTPTTPYTSGDFVYNGTNVYQCTSNGVSGALPGPTGQEMGQVDGSTSWDFVADKSANISMTATQIPIIEAVNILVNVT